MTRNGGGPRFRTLAETSLDLLFLMRSDGILVDVNEAALPAEVRVGAS